MEDREYPRISILHFVDLVLDLVVVSPASKIMIRVPILVELASLSPSSKGSCSHSIKDQQ